MVQITNAHGIAGIFPFELIIKMYMKTYLFNATATHISTLAGVPMSTLITINAIQAAMMDG